MSNYSINYLISEKNKVQGTGGVGELRLSAGSVSRNSVFRNSVLAGNEQEEEEESAGERGRKDNSPSTSEFIKLTLFWVEKTVFTSDRDTVRFVGHSYVHLRCCGIC